jgi:hypothetical protein
MYDDRAGRFRTADNIDDLKAAIPPEHRGPVFQQHEVVQIRGKRGEFVVIGAEGGSLLLQYRPPDTTRNRRERRRR